MRNADQPAGFLLVMKPSTSMLEGFFSERVYFALISLMRSKTTSLAMTAWTIEFTITRTARITGIQSDEMQVIVSS